VVARPAH